MWDWKSFDVLKAKVIVQELQETTTCITKSCAHHTAKQHIDLKLTIVQKLIIWLLEFDFWKTRTDDRSSNLCQ